MCFLLCCIAIFPIGSSHLSLGNGTYFIWCCRLRLPCATKTTIGVMPLLFQNASCLLLSTFGAQKFILSNPILFEVWDEYEKEQLAANLQSKSSFWIPYPKLLFSKIRSFCLNFFEPVGVEHAQCHASWVTRGVKSATLVAKFSIQ